MKLNKKLAILGILALSMPAAAQTRWLAEAVIGSNAGLGYSKPHTSFGIQAEKSVLPRLEMQGFARFSPDNKVGTGDGNGLVYGGIGIFTVGHNFGFTAGVRQSLLFTSQYSKTATTPTLGFAIAEGTPGRFFLNYAFPTGCVWGRGCPIQSNRLRGIELAQETWATEKVQVGARLGVYSFFDQANPLVRSRRTEHLRATASFFVRYRLS